MGEELLEIKNLSTSFRIADDYYAAVDDVTLSVRKNEILAIVGESGSGKSALAFSIMGLHTRAKIDGQIKYKGQDIVTMSPAALNKAARPRNVYDFSRSFIRFKPANDHRLTD